MHTAEPITIPYPVIKPETEPKPDIEIEPSHPSEDDPWNVPVPKIQPAPKA